MPAARVSFQTHTLPLLCALLLAGCASTALTEAEQQARAGQYEQAYTTLSSALQARPDDASLRTAQARARDRVMVRMLTHAELAMSAGRLEEAQRVVDRAKELDPANLRVAGLHLNLQRALRDEAWAREARAALDAGRPEEARPLIDAVLKSQPGHVGARALRQRLPRPAEATSVPATLAEAFQRPITLEFRDAQLRQVFETLARASSVNFVFDKDVRADARITVFLRNVTLDEALRVVLATQQLDRKLLNDTTLLVYPNTPAKQREHQELVTRSLYLANADPKQAAAMLRTMTKTRDVHIDERLNALVVRDVPEVVAQIEKLLATIDLREPEVMLAVEVMEVASDRVEELGIAWPSEIQFGIPNAAGQISLSLRDQFRGSVANPAALIALRGSSGATNLLANPTIRARNREKAKVQIGEKLPVFTTTSTANVGVSTTVNYLDVGLKLDVEPSVQSDGEVVIKLALEVSNLLREVTGPGGALAYQVGTRMTTTSLRLRDGETQVLAGLINDEERRRTNGIPGLSELPTVGRLFGASDDTRSKTEIVMLITPRVVYGLDTPDRDAATVASGTDAMPGSAPLRLRAEARVSQPLSTSAAAEASGGGRGGRRPSVASQPAGLVLSASEEAGVGDTVSVTLSNNSAGRIEGELEYDPDLLELLSGKPGSGLGRIAVDLAARDELVAVLRVRPAGATAQQVTVAASWLRGVGSSGEAVEVGVEGPTTTRIRTPEPRR